MKLLTQGDTLCGGTDHHGFLVSPGERSHAVQLTFQLEPNNRNQKDSYVFKQEESCHFCGGGRFFIGLASAPFVFSCTFGVRTEGPLETLQDCPDLGTEAGNHYHQVYGTQWTQTIIEDSAFSLVTTGNILTNFLYP